MRKLGSDAHSCGNATTDLDANAKQTIAGAVACITPGNGDTVDVHVGVYNESVDLSGKGGSSGNPTVIRGHASEAVDVTGDPAFTATSTSYLRVTGFTFNGANNSCKGTTAVILFRNVSGDKTISPTLGDEATNNVFTNCGNQGNLVGHTNQPGNGIRVIGLGHDDNWSPTNYDGGTISGNTFTNFTGDQIANGGASDIRITNNTSTGGHSGATGFDWAEHFYNVGSTTVQNNTFITPQRVKVDTNTVSGFIADSYATGPAMDCAGVRMDSSTGRHLIFQNTFHDLCNNTGSWTFQTEAWAVYGEANVNNIRVEQNIAYNISEACYRWGSSNQNAAHDNIVINNVCRGTFQYAMELWKSFNITVENNAFSEGGQGQIVVCAQSVSAGNVFKNNNYVKVGNSAIARYSPDCTAFPYFYPADKNLTQWNASSGETGDLNTDPLFVNANTDFHLQNGSPLKLAGFCTPACDIGAYPNASVAAAGTYFVRSGATGTSCSTYTTDDATHASPTIQAAVNCAAFGAGDIVDIHTGTYVENVVLSTSGTVSGQWIIRAHSGETVDVAPTSGYAIFGTNTSYITIRDFTFAHQTAGFGSIRVLNNTGDKNNTPVRGVQILNNTFNTDGENGVANGGNSFRQIYLQGAGMGDLYNGAAVNTISGNTATNSYGDFINLQGSSDTTVDSNSATGQRSSKNGFVSRFQAFGIHAPSDTINSIAVTPMRNVITNNTFATWARQAYEGATTVEMACLRAETGFSSGTVRGNTCHDLGFVAWTTLDRSYGMFLESNTNTNLLTQNIIYNVNEAGIKFGSNGTTLATSNQIVNNAIYNVLSGGCVVLENAKSTLIQNTIGTACGAGQIYVSVASVNAGGTTLQNNDWWKSGTSLVGTWNWDSTVVGATPEPTATQTAAQFNASSGQTNSLNADPVYTAAGSNFHLQITSPCLSTGVGGVDMGAYLTNGFVNPVCGP